MIHRPAVIRHPTVVRHYCSSCFSWHHGPCVRLRSHWPHHTIYIGGTVRVIGYSVPRVYVHRVVVEDAPRVLIRETERTYLSRQERLIDELLRGDAEQRENAARELSDYEDIGTIAALQDALINDAEPAVREAAARSLGQIRSPLAYEALLRMVEAEDDPEVRDAAEQAAQAIVEYVGQDKLSVSSRWPEMTTPDDQLGVYLEDLRFADAKQREKAAGKLHDYPGTQTVAALIDAMINDANEEVREEAAESLGKVGDRMALPFLQWARQHDPDKSTRDDAEDSIEKIYNTIQ